MALTHALVNGDEIEDGLGGAGSSVFEHVGLVAYNPIPRYAVKQRCEGGLARGFLKGLANIPLDLAIFVILFVRLVPLPLPATTYPPTATRGPPSRTLLPTPSPPLYLLYLLLLLVFFFLIVVILAILTAATRIIFI